MTRKISRAESPTTLLGNAASQTNLNPIEATERLPFWAKLFGVLEKTRNVVINFIFVALVAALLWLVFDSTRHDQIVIDPVSLPTLMKNLGYTEDVVSMRLYDELRFINGHSDDTKSTAKVLTSSQELDIAAPGTGVSLKSITLMARRLFNIPQTHVIGSFLCPRDSCKLADVSFHFRVSRGSDHDTELLPPMGEMAPDDYLKLVGEKIMRKVNPITLAESYGNTRREKEALNVANEIVDANHKDKEKAENLLGVFAFNGKRFDVAAHWFRESIRTNPNFSLARANLGYLLAAADVTNEQLARARDDNGPDRLSYLSEVKLSDPLNDPARLLEGNRELSKAVAIDSKASLNYVIWGDTLSKAGKHEEAFRA
jgi:hypothetical protein